MSFEEFLTEELEGLSRYSRLLTGDRQQAHDVLAEAMVNAYGRWNKIAVMEHPLAYVRRIVTTTYLGEQRSWAHRMIHPTPPDRLPDPGSLDSDLLRVDDRMTVAQLLTTLSPKQRAAVVLRFYVGLSMEEIAASLSSTPAGVRSLLSRALAAMRITVTEYAPQEADASRGTDVSRRNP